MLTRIRARLLPFALLLVLTLSGTSYSQVNDGVDTSYIGSDTFFAMVIRPMQLIKYANDEKTRDAVLDLMQRESGINVRKLDELVVQFGNENRSGADARSLLDSEEYVSMVFRFAEPIGREVIMAKMFDNADAATHEKMTYYQARSEHQPSGYFPNDRSLVIAKERRLKKMMTEKHSMGSMVHRLRKAGTSDDMLAIVSISSGRELSREAVKIFDFFGGGELPISPAEIVNLVDDVVVEVNLSDDVPIKVGARAKSDAGAVEVQKQVSALLTFIKTVYPPARQRILDKAPNKELGKLSVDVIEAILAGTKVEVQDKDISIRLEREGGLPQLIELFSQSVGQEAKREVAVEAVEDSAVPADDAPATE